MYYSILDFRYGEWFALEKNNLTFLSVMIILSTLFYCFLDEDYETLF